MRFKFCSSMLIPVAGLALLGALPVTTAEDEAAQPKDTRPIPRLPNGKPDLSGVWDHPRVGDFTKGAKGCVGQTEGCSASAEVTEMPWTAAGQAAHDADAKF